MDETYIRVRAKWEYLYRAVVKHGKTVNFLLRPDRGVRAAKAFFSEGTEGISAAMAHQNPTSSRANRLVLSLASQTVIPSYLAFQS